MRKLVLMELDRVGLVALLLLTAVGLLMAFAAVTGFYYPWHDSSRPPVGIPEELVVVLLAATVVVPLISTVLGWLQTDYDRRWNLTAYVSTRATTRGRMLAARLIVGGLIIVASIALMVLAVAAMFYAFPRLLPVGATILVAIFVTMLAAALPAYAAGLVMGWSQIGRLRILVLLGLLLVILLAVLMMGSRPRAWITLAVLAVAMIGWLHHRYVHQPL